VSAADGPGSGPVSGPVSGDGEYDVDVILDQVADGRHHAFDIVVARYGGRVRRYLRQTVGDDAALEDLSQEVFVRIFRGANSRRRRGAFPLWLFRVARSIAVDHVRRTQTDRRTRAGWQPQFEARQQAMQTPLEQAETSELERQFRSVIEAVPEEFRTPFLLREQESMSYEQIAEVLDCSIKTVSTRIFRARQRLRGLLASFVAADGPPSRSADQEGKVSR
ncbi:MAG: RNA polymerase sigma factor, partial [Planctomycetota bacterium]